MNQVKPSDNQKWYRKDWAAILFLVVFWPVGLYLMWKYTGWSKNVKIVISSLFGILFLIGFFGAATAPPTITIDNVENGRIDAASTTHTLTGEVFPTDSTVTVNDKSASINSGKFSIAIELEEGDNTVVVVAKAGNGKSSSQTIVISRPTAAELSAKQAETDKQNAEAAAAAQAEAQQRAAEEAAKNQPKTSFGDGTYLVGKDIVAGTYRTEGGSSCYYERLKDTSGSFGAIIANDNAQGPAVVTIAASDAAFKSQGCGTWNKI